MQEYLPRAFHRRTERDGWLRCHYPLLFRLGGGNSATPRCRSSAFAGILTPSACCWPASTGHGGQPGPLSTLVILSCLRPAAACSRASRARAGTSDEPVAIPIHDFFDLTHQSGRQSPLPDSAARRVPALPQPHYTSGASGNGEKESRGVRERRRSLVQAIADLRLMG